jgi:hypothetical protein
VTRARTCDDCYFRQNGLCALATVRPCPTFRDVRAGRMVRKPQATLVARYDDATPTADERELAAV